MSNSTLAETLYNISQDCNRDEAIAEINKRLNNQAGQIKALVEVLEFYADPGTYFGIFIMGDPPCGTFIEDFSETDLGGKPGKLARHALAMLEAKGERMDKSTTINYEYPYPCYCCVYNNKIDVDEPCYHCIHNVNANVEQTDRFEPIMDLK